MKRKYVYKRVLSAFLIAVMLLGGMTNAYASKIDEAQDKINDAKDKKEEAQANLDKVNKEIDKLNAAQDALQAEMDAYDEELMALLTDLSILEEDISFKRQEIDQAQADLEAAKIKEATQYESMKLRIQYMYENGGESVWASLAEATEMSEVLNRVEYVNSVYDYDRNQLTEYQNTVQEVKDLTEKLDLEMIEMEELQANMNEQQVALETLIAESSARMENFNTQLANASSLAKKYAQTIKKQNSIISKQEAVIKEERKKEEQKKNESITGGSNPSYTTNVSGSDVVDYACQFVGNPYVYGGTSLTKGCDCSYFVKACYGNFGISLPRTSYQQRSVGQAVSYSNAKAGDIICYAGHVAIYMGDGKIVHAANARQGICYGTATYRTIITVRRVL